MSLKIEILHDESPESPREWDNLTTIVAKHSRYDLGDDNSGIDIQFNEFASWDEVALHIRRTINPAVMLPLYLYEHSGIAVSTRSFIGRAQHAEWDSGQVGLVIVKRETLLENFGRKRITQALLARATEIANAEIETYSQYLSGDTWGYQVTENETGFIVDSCWGFFGRDHAEQEAQSVLKQLSPPETEAENECVHCQ